MQQDLNTVLIELLDLAVTRKPAVDGFAVGLLRATDYIHGRRVGCMRVDLPLLVYGEARHAKADVCVVDRPGNDILPLVREDKGLERLDQINPRAQLVAGAVPAFDENNVQREAFGHPAVAHEVSRIVSWLGFSGSSFPPRSCPAS